MRTLRTIARVMLIAIIAILFAGQLPAPTLAQGGIANPPVVSIELGSIEPTPGNVAAQVSFSAEQGANFRDETINSLKWVYSRDISYPGETDLIACGINGTPTALLTDPAGQTQTVSLTIANWGGNNCWMYTVPWASGTRLGQYTLQIADDSGSIQRQWKLAYPDYPTSLYTIENQEIVLMGFRPNQVVTVLFYGYNEPGGIGTDTTFWASRKIKVDSQGAAILALNLTSSAAFANVKYLVAGYPFAHLSWRRYSDWRKLNYYSTPDVMISDYYNAINQRWYDMAWENLSAHYKDKYNAGAGGHDFAAYMQWWNSVGKVDIIGLTVSSQQGEFATVTTNLQFTMRAGGTSQATVNFIVIYSASEDRWLFYDQN